MKWPGPLCSPLNIGFCCLGLSTVMVDWLLNSIFDQGIFSSLGVKFGKCRPCRSLQYPTKHKNVSTPLILNVSSPNCYHRCISWGYTRYHTIFRFDLLFKVKEVKVKFSHFWPLWHVYYMWCIPTKYTYSKNLVMLHVALIVTSEMALVRFRLMPPGGHIWIPIGRKFGIHIVAA
jgi:hypothetical protein